MKIKQTGLLVDGEEKIKFLSRRNSKAPVLKITPGMSSGM